MDYKPGGQEAFLGTLSEGLHEQAQNKLKMALLSSQIKQEAEARMAEQQQAHELGMVPSEQGAALSKALGFNLPENVGALPGQTLGTLLQAEGMSNRANAMMNKPQHVILKADANGLVTTGFMSPATGQWVTPPQQTLDPHNADIVHKSEAATQSTASIIQGMNQRLQAALTQVPGYVPGQEAMIKMNQLLPFDPQLKVAMDEQAGRVMQIMKNTQGTAGRNWEMIQAEMRGFGEGSDTVQTALQKQNDKMTDIRNTNAATLQFYDPTNFLKSSNHPTIVGAHLGQQMNQNTTPKGIKYSVTP